MPRIAPGHDRHVLRVLKVYSLGTIKIPGQRLERVYQARCECLVDGSELRCDPQDLQSATPEEVENNIEFVKKMQSRTKLAMKRLELAAEELNG